MIDEWEWHWLLLDVIRHAITSRSSEQDCLITLKSKMERVDD